MPSLPTEQPRLSPEAPSVEQPAVEHAETTQETVETQPVEQKIAPQPAEGGARLPRRPKTVTQRPVPVVRDEMATKIEKILEENIGDAYTRLSPIAKQEFKLKGEQTASQIRELMKATHVKIKKIFQLIVDWLKLLPGVNRFFLMQEAKIKTDRIISLHHKK